MTNSYVLSLIALMTLAFGLETLADLLNLTRLNDPLPSEFQEIFDQPKYNRALAYQKEKTYFGLIQGVLGFTFTLGFLFLGGFGILDRWVVSQGFNPGLNGIAYFAVLLGLKLILSLPFSLYDTFVLEEKYGFNRTTSGIFIGDLVKAVLLSVILGIPVYLGIAYFFEKAGVYGWLIAWFAFTLFQILLMYLAPAVIMPLFNKFTPLPESPAKDAILAYAKKQNFRLNGIYTMDSSKRSTKSNAFFTGFGKFRRLVLFDSLLEKHTPEELVSIFAHEVGHFKKKHILKSMLLGLLPTALLFYAVGWVLGNEDLFNAFAMTGPSVYGGLIFVSLFFGPVSEFLGILTQFLSRKYEFEADEFSVATYGRPESMISALKKLSADNLSHLTPHPLKVLLEYTHPPILERIRALKERL